MKIKKSFSILFILLSIGFLTIQCQHDDEDIIPIKGPDPITHGEESFNCTDCTPLTTNGATADFNAGGVPVGSWYFDKSHSSVLWETPYKVFGSMLTGRFNYFAVKSLTFNEASPATIAFEGYVRLNTVNTGEPGRDGGCLLSTFGTESTKTSEPENLAVIKSIPNSGKYSTTDASFIVEANMTFNGVTKPVTLKLFYNPLSDQGSYNMVGLTAQFDFLALSQFGIVNSNIDDKVTVKMNLNFKNKKA